MVMRVSLSDWLAFQAGIRGFENPRLLRDRPTDGAAMARNCMRLFWGTVPVYAGIGGVVGGMRREFGSRALVLMHCRR